MKTTILCVSIAGLIAVAASAQNANVTWQNPQNISGASDVSLDGTFFASWAPGDDWGGTLRADYYPVNGVTFGAYGIGANFNFSGSGINLDRYNGFANPNTADGNYNYLLQTAVFNWNSGSSDMIISWDSMTVGQTYEIQLWLNDGRNGQTGSSTFTGGANTSASVAIGNNTPGQYIIGTFVADNSSEQLTMSPGIMLNLMQVRIVPEPSTIALFAVGAGAVVCGFRRKSRV
jgi:hypothetical protein